MKNLTKFRCMVLDAFYAVARNTQIKYNKLPRVLAGIFAPQHLPVYIISKLVIARRSQYSDSEIAGCSMLKSKY